MPDDVPTQHDPRPNVAPRQHVAPMRHPRASYWTLVLASLMPPLTAGAAEPLPSPGVHPRVPATKPTTKPNPAATRPSLQTPLAQTVRDFRDALRANNQPAALALLATSPQPVRDADRRVQRLAKNLASGTWDFSLLDAKSTGDLGVVLINDHLKDTRQTTDIKPWYLLRQNGHWRLLGKFTDFELKEYDFDATTIDQYRALEDWADRRTPDLKKELPDCGC